MLNKTSIFRGCLLGLAVGDAMGHTVDRRTLEQIREDYGPNGLMGYDLVNGYADVTSYTQLAAFSANGLLLGLTRGQIRGVMAPPVRYIALAIREWSRSQQFSDPEQNHCWLSTVPELKRRFCMDPWMLGTLGGNTLGTMEEPANLSDHPAPLTEVIPVALQTEDLNLSIEERCRLGAEAVALTHGPDAFLSGAALTYVLSRIATSGAAEPLMLVQETLDAIQMQFGRAYPYQTAKLCELAQMAITLSRSEDSTAMQAMELLRCKTAPEVLAGALYACLTCEDNFDTAIITAVNHSGRSAAVGAITGAIMGAIMGENALPEFYLECLEPTAYLMELADDMVQGCPMEAASHLYDHDWDRKYLHAGK